MNIRFIPRHFDNKTMFRKVESLLKQWQENQNKKALLVTGARQIGKTYSIRKFGQENYRTFVEINFITNPSAKEIFSGDLNADVIIMNLTAYLGKSLTPKETLVFFDEIQECPNARTAIKFLVEDGRFDYISSGSLLGVNYKAVPSYPVGYEEILRMYPMDFEEFALANGLRDETLGDLKKCYDTKEPVTVSVHKTMTDLFKYYVMVGGMPAVVKTFIETHDIGKVVSVQKDIISQYLQDIAKYTQNGKEKVCRIFDRIPSQLDEKNRRFKLSSIDKSARLREYEDAFIWLRDAGVALPCFNLTEPKIPLKINEQSRLFKLFMSDCGLLCAMGLENVQFDILQGNLSVNMGSILENVFAQQLNTNGFALRYLNKSKIGELDFVVQFANKIMALEIKSGKDYHSHTALDNALKVAAWNLEQGVVFCCGNLEKTGKILYLPWYMVMFFKQPSLSDLKVQLNLNL